MTPTSRPARTGGSRLLCAADGFTVLELMIGLLIGGVLMTVAHAAMSAAMTTLARVGEQRTLLEGRVNAHRWLRVVFASIEVGADGGRFDGRPDAVSFYSWLETVDGWSEGGSVQISLAGRRLQMRAGKSSVVLADDVDSVAFDYLSSPGTAGRWVRGWSSPVDPPFAVRLRLARPNPGGVAVDTSLFLIRGRG